MSKNSKMVKVLDNNTIEVNLPNGYGHELIAMESSASFAKIVGFGKERIEDLKTAVSEACLNAMEHGNRGRPGTRVIVTMSFMAGTFSVSVRDEGEGILDLPEDHDITKKIERLIPARGLGIFLMKELMDDVEFKQLNKSGHEVRMFLRLA